MSEILIASYNQAILRASCVHMLPLVDRNRGDKMDMK